MGILFGVRCGTRAAAVAIALLGLMSAGASTATAFPADPLVPSGQLVPSEGPVPLQTVAISGQTVVATESPGSENSGHFQRRAFVFTEPTGGWAGTREQTATLVAADGSDLGPEVAISGQTLVISAANQNVLYVFTEPAGGWSGSVYETARLT